MIIIADKVLASADSMPVEYGAVVVSKGKILGSGPRERMAREHPGHRTMVLHGAVLMPGLVNAHTHLELPPLPNSGRARDYAGWVMNLILAKSRLRERDYVHAARENVQELIRTGTTTVGDICTHGVSPAVLATSGLRAVIFHEIISMAAGGGPSPLPRLPRSGRLIRHGLSPHSPHTVSDSVLVAVRRLAERRGLPVCMHVAETNDERSLLRRQKSGLDRLYAMARWERSWAPMAPSSFRHLQRAGILGPSFLAVHAVDIDRQDIGVIKRSGAGVAHCPRSNHALRTGTMQLRKLLRTKVPVGLGTDSLASVPTLSLWDEMRFVLQVHRPSGITAADLLGLATLGGAQALGMQREIGSIEPGKFADLIAVPLPSRDTGDLCSDLLRETESCIMSMVNGKIIHRQFRTTR